MRKFKKPILSKLVPINEGFRNIHVATIRLAFFQFSYILEIMYSLFHNHDTYMKNQFDLSDLLFEYPNYSVVKLPSIDTWILYSKIKGMLNRCDYSVHQNEVMTLLNNDNYLYL